jgi:signal transduction histidine kinase
MMMTHRTSGWNNVRAATRGLNWTLTRSHLKVTLIAQGINLVGAALIVLFAGQKDVLPTTHTMAEVTRVLAITLSDSGHTRSAADLSATLARLASRFPPATAASNVLTPATAIVVVSPSGAVLATSTPDVPTGMPSTRLEPSVWGEILDAARYAEFNTTPSPLSYYDSRQRVMVSGYPIHDSQGRMYGVLGVRSGPLPLHILGNHDSVVTTRIAFFGTLFLLVSAIASLVASSVGMLLARTFSQRLHALAQATEAITCGDRSARVAITEHDEIGQIAARFNVLAERLDEVEHARRRFVANISHELRTPLAIIRGHLETQITNTTHATASLESLSTIDRETRALGALIDDLFSLSRIEETGLSLHPQPVAVQSVAMAAASGIRPLASRQGHVAVQVLIPSDLPPVLADPQRLSQILNNLLYNALRHTPAGGVIVIEGQVIANGTVIELAVTDTGVGISPADLPHIFDRFFRAHSGEATGGSGIGLAIVKQLVEAQAGTIHAESVEGQGTTLRVRLPRAQERER